jgi:hypothetical protein
LNKLDEILAELDKRLSAIGPSQIDNLLGTSPSRVCCELVDGLPTEFADCEPPNRLTFGEDSGLDSDLTISVSSPVTWESMLVELCAADLEWRIRLAHALLGGEAAERASLSYGPSAIRGYLKFASEQAQKRLDDSDAIEDVLHNCWHQLLLTEWRARSAWGDRPNVDKFIDIHDREDIAFDEAVIPTLDATVLEDELTELAPLIVRVEDKAEQKTTAEGGESIAVLPARFTFGRQDIGEPEAPCWLAESRRLVAVPHGSKQISREQVGIRRVEVNRVEATNLSRKVTISLGGKKLSPGDSTILQLPLLMTVMTTHLRFSLHDEIGNQ